MQHSEQPQDSDLGRQAEIRNQPGVGTHQPEVGDQQPEASGQLNAEVQILQRELMRVLLKDKEMELAKVKRTLTSAKEEAKTARSKAEEVCHRLASWKTELCMFILKAELEKLHEIEALRKEFDRERRQLREDRECEAMQFSEWKHELTADRDRLGEEVNVLVLQLRLTMRVQNRSESLMAGVDGCTGTEEPEALVVRPEVNVVPKSGDGTGEEQLDSQGRIVKIR